MCSSCSQRTIYELHNVEGSFEVEVRSLLFVQNVPRRWLSSVRNNGFVLIKA